MKSLVIKGYRLVATGQAFCVVCWKWPEDADPDADWWENIFSDQCNGVICCVCHAKLSSQPEA